MEINLKRPELEDRDLINSYLKDVDTRSCERTFANTYLWSRHYQVGFAIVEDMLVFGRLEGEISFTFPVGRADEKKALDALLNYCEERGVSFRLHNITGDEFAKLEACYPGQLEVFYDRNYADYVYEATKLASLSGKKYHSKKNHVNKFKKLYPDWKYEPITRENVEECFQMALRWRELNGCEANPDKHAEICVTLNFLRLFEELQMRGGALRVNDQIVAFTIGEPVGKQKDTLVVHIEKAFSEVQGAYAMINQQFAEHEGVNFTYMNREDDMGEEGLRQAKMSYKPVFLIEKGVVRKRALL